MSYLTLLKAFLSLGPRLPEVFQRVQRIVAEVQELWEILKPADESGVLKVTAEFEPSAEELAAEAEVYAALTPEGSLALGDGAVLRKVFTALASNPQLWSLVIGLLTKV
jgi:hypothetical protein